MHRLVWGSGVGTVDMNHRKTVAIVVPDLTGGGGVPAVARFLCKAIEQSNYFNARLFSLPSSVADPASLRLVAPRTWPRGPVVEKGEWEKREFEHVGAVFAEFEFQRYRPRRVLTSLLRECDLVQVVAGNPAWALVASRAGRPVTLQVATLASVERQERFRQERGPLALWRRAMTRVTRQLERRAVQVADRIFVENRWMEKTLSAWTQPGRVVLAAPGVDTEVFRPPHAGVDRPPQGVYILSVARWEDRRKNLRLLLEAYARLKREMSSEVPRLVLAGETGPLRKDWALARDLGISNSVSFHKRPSRKELANLYRHAAVFVLPSSEEGLGLVLLEAMASGTPVVSTATEGAQQALEDGVTGVLTPIGDPGALAAAMNTLLGNPGRRRELGERGRERAIRHFSQRTAAERFLAVYRELIGTESRTLKLERAG